ncbi:MAG: type II toxin-antitoxin system HicA family toxin [Chitinophagaceae bacterium]|nr:type II toxin-antitoxin system HicA family toxin [Chitinophagaceae bacterium]
MNYLFMKSSELHRLILRNGWRHIRTAGSHYIYEKESRTYPDPFHGTNKVGKGLEKKIKKEMKLK